MKTALLVTDMQNFFSEMVPPSTLSNITTLISHFWDRSLPIIFTEHGHSDEELTQRPFRNQLIRKWGPDDSIRVGTQDWEFIPAIEKLVRVTSAQVVSSQENTVLEDVKAVVIHKSAYDAFIGT